MNKTETLRIAKNFLQSVIAGMAYAISVKVWFPNANGAILSIITSIVILGNVMDPDENMKVLKKQGVIAIITLFSIIMLAEVLRNSEEQKWWQNVLNQSIVTTIFVCIMESVMPKLNYYSNIKTFKDFIMSIINAIGIFTALTTVSNIEDCYTAIIITMLYVVLATIDFEDDKKIIKQQCLIAFVVSIMAIIFTMFFSEKIDVYLALIFGVSISNLAYSFLMKFLMNGDYEDEDLEEDDKAFDEETEDLKEDDETFEKETENCVEEGKSAEQLEKSEDVYEEPEETDEFVESEDIEFNDAENQINRESSEKSESEEVSFEGDDNDKWDADMLAFFNEL